MPVQPALFTLRLLRGDDFVQAFRLTDRETGDPIDLTGYGIELLIKAAAGDPGAPLIAARMVDDPTITGITYIGEPTDGWFQVVIRRQALEPIPGPFDIERFAWNLRLIDADGFEVTYAHGPCEIVPEVIDG